MSAAATVSVAAQNSARTPVQTGSGSLVWLYALIGALAALHISMIFGRSINWDEFWFYSQVEIVARGDYIQPLQTIHTRIFAWWLPAMGGSEIDHIQIARLFMLACLAVTAGAIVLAAETFTDRRTGLLAAAAYLGAGFVLQHGTAFRVDPMVSACLASAFAIGARSRMGPPAILAMGALIGLAAMVTIKMALWLPAFAGLALYRWDENGFDWRYPLRWLTAGIVAAATFALLYLLHASGAEAEAAADTLGGSSRMFAPFHIPNLQSAGKAFATALPLAIFAALAPWMILRKETRWPRRIALLAIWATVLIPLVYYNSFPYFYVFILPPIAIIAALAIPMVSERYGEKVIAAVIILSALATWIVDARGVTPKQQQLVAAVHEVFPEPVNYFDCCGMIAGFSKQNQFRTQWGVALYLDSGEPEMLQAMQAMPIPLLLDNNREFSSAQLGIRTDSYHPKDFAALEQTYIRHWGDIFVSGRELEAGASLDWDVLVPGTYTASGALSVNGTDLADGDTIQLKRGRASLANSGDKTARLIWGTNPALPQGTPPDAYWTSF